jgi:hypothetical protein
VNREKKTLTADDANLRAQSEYELIVQAQDVSEELLAGLTQCMEFCLQDAELNITRIEQTLDEFLRSWPAEGSEEWTN